MGVGNRFARALVRSDLDLVPTFFAGAVNQNNPTEPKN